MSKKYKESMDKIVLSEELRAKIIENANHLPEKNKKNIKMLYIKRAAGYAACFLVCFTALSYGKGFIFPNDSLENAPSALPTETAAPVFQSALPTAESPKYTAPVNTPESSEALPNDSKPSLNAASGEKTVKRTSAPAAEKPIVKGTENNDSNTPEPEAPQTSEVPVQKPTEPPMPEENIDYEPPGGFEQGVFMPSPSSDAASADELMELVGYSFKLPRYIPEEYKSVSYSLLFGSLVQIEYESDNGSITYRTEQANEDISGDYNSHDITNVEKINGINVIIKGSDNLFYTAIWEENDYSYAVSVQNGIEKSELIKIIENIN